MAARGRQARDGLQSNGTADVVMMCVDASQFLI